MKSFVIAICFTMLAGCSTIQKFMPSNFDNVEFGKLVELNVIFESPLIGEDWCREMDIHRMAFVSNQLRVYSENRLNANISKIYSEIDKLVMELKNKENPSSAYCKIKRGSIHKVTEDALKVFGSRKA